MADVSVADRLTKYYNGRPVVNQLSLRVPQGSVYGFLGRNGSGKSTTIKMLLGMVHPDYGRAELLGEDSWQLRPQTRAVIAYLAWLCYRRQRRLHLPWTGAWVAFVFLFGVPGLVGYLVHRRWPPVTPCEGCGQAVPRDRPACARCGQEFSPPPPTGKEIFA